MGMKETRKFWILAVYICAVIRFCVVSRHTLAVQGRYLGMNVGLQAFGKLWVSSGFRTRYQTGWMLYRFVRAVELQRFHNFLYRYDFDYQAETRVSPIDSREHETFSTLFYDRVTWVVNFSPDLKALGQVRLPGIVLIAGNLDACCLVPALWRWVDLC